MPISAAELILHPDGSIYHLGLLPEDLATTIITVGDPERVSQVSDYFDRIEVKKSYREFVTHTGWLGKKRISVISTGIGTDNIDIVLNELDALVNIDLKTRTIKDKLTSLQIIRIGTSGSLQEDIPVDSLLKSQYGIGIDSLLHFYDYHPNEEYAKIVNDFNAYNVEFGFQPYIGVVGNDLFDRLGSDFIHGLTLTCPGFYAPQGRVLRYKSKFEGYLSHIASWQMDTIRATNFEMETSAIYGLSNLLGHQAISLNAIIANRPQGVFSKDPKKLVKKLIEKGLQEISDLL